MPDSSLSGLAGCLRLGQVVIYPTETFYAVGGLAFDPKAAGAVFKLKNRPAGHPLPVIIGSMDQLTMLARPDPAHIKLARQFWPGSLSILFQVNPDGDLPPELTDSRGLVAIRLTPHPLAARLCLAAGGPLSASSANISGRPPVTNPDLLDAELRSAAAGVLTGQPAPQGGLPSTLVEIDEGRIRILRPGRVSAQDLQKAGWLVTGGCCS